MKKGLLLFVLVLGCMSKSYAQPLLVENFDSPIYIFGTAIDSTIWRSHSGTVPDTVAPGLTYAGYPGSGIGCSVKLSAGGSTDYNHTFTAQPSGTVYSFFMVNVSAVTASGDYFFHYSANPFNGGTTGIRGRVFAKVNATADSVSFGLAFGSGGTIYTGMNYLTNTTYLCAFKNKVGPGTNDDTVSLFVFSAPTIPASEPSTATVGPLGDAATSDNVGGPGSVALRQGGSNQPTLRIDGIRVATTWAGALSATNVENGSLFDHPISYALLQNYPNPFNPSTNFTYQIGKEGFVSMKIYNVLGQEVATLVNEVKQAGTYPATWNAASFESGVYFCKMQSGTFSETKKLILMK